MEPGPLNTNLGPGPVNTNSEPGLLNTNWGPGPVNTNWGPGPGAKQGAGGQARGRGLGNANTPLLNTKKLLSKRELLQLLSDTFLLGLYVLFEIRSPCLWHPHESPMVAFPQI